MARFDAVTNQLKAEARSLETRRDSIGTYLEIEVASSGAIELASAKVLSDLTAIL